MLIRFPCLSAFLLYCRELESLASCCVKSERYPRLLVFTAGLELVSLHPRPLSNTWGSAAWGNGAAVNRVHVNGTTVMYSERFRIFSILASIPEQKLENCQRPCNCGGCKPGSRSLATGAQGLTYETRPRTMSRQHLVAVKGHPCKSPISIQECTPQPAQYDRS